MTPSNAPISTRVIIDTGDTSTLTFHTPFVEEHDLVSSAQKVVAHSSTGLSGQSRNWRGRIASFLLGSTTLIQPIVTFSAATTGSEADSSYDAVLGGEMLRRFRLTLNYARREMILEPNVAFSEPYEDDMSGATLSAQGPDLRQVLVQTVAADSPASQLA